MRVVRLLIKFRLWLGPLRNFVFGLALLTGIQQLYTAGIALLEAYLLAMANNQRNREERLSQEQNGR